MQSSFFRQLPCMYCKNAKNDNFTALQSMQGILHITALQPCEFLPLLNTFFHSALVSLVGT